MSENIRINKTEQAPTEQDTDSPSPIAPPPICPKEVGGKLSYPETYC